MAVINPDYLDRAFAWFDREPTQATHQGGFFTVVHRQSGIAVTRRDYCEAVADLYHECHRTATQRASPGTTCTGVATEGERCGVCAGCGNTEEIQ